MVFAATVLWVSWPEVALLKILYGKAYCPDIKSTNPTKDECAAVKDGKL
jgi:hypothetical protein